MPDLVLGIREGFLEEVTSGLDLGEEELLAVLVSAYVIILRQEVIRHIFFESL